jgi:hypothetical protein
MASCDSSMRHRTLCATVRLFETWASTLVQIDVTTGLVSFFVKENLNLLDDSF